jgi:sortase (surface protein transpeptidase)
VKKSTIFNRLFLLVTCLCIFQSGFGQAIWSSAALTDANPSSYNPFTLSQTNVANITVSGIGRGPGINGNTASNRYNARDWSTSGMDLTDYFYFRITPGSGYAVNFVSFVYTGQKSGTGPVNFAIRSSVDNYAADITTTTSTGTTVTLSGASYQNISSVIEFRIYAWGGSSAAGTYSVNSFSFNGAVVTAAAPCAVPTALLKNDITDSSVTLSWTAASGSPVGYEYAVTTSSASPASGTANAGTSLSVSSLDDNTKYYVHLRTDCGSGAFSNWVKDSFTTLTSCIAASVTTEPGNVTVCDGTAALLHIAASGTSVTYQWQVNSGSGFTDVSNGASYSGANNDSIIILQPNASYAYRCVVSNSCGSDTSDAATININPVYSINNPQVICSGGSYVINGHTYTAANTYNDTLQSVNGCDSIIVTQLTVNPAYSINNPQTICSGGSYVINGNTYTTANTYHDTLHTVAGCDSIIVTQLSVNPVYSINNPQTICTGGSYIINGHTYTIANTYHDTLHAVAGCDSIIVTQLTVNAAYSINNPQTICSGGSYVINGHTYTIADTYQDTLHTVAGCDSIIVTQLTVNSTYSVNNPQTICNGGSYMFNGHTYTTANTYHDTLHTVNGCDSIIVTQLTVNPSYSINNPQVICNGGSYAFNGNTYTAANTYRDTLHTVTGCDSIIVTQLTVNPTYSINNPQTICTGGAYVINGHTYTTANTYRDTFHTVFGCDSIIITQLSVGAAYNINNPQSICTGGSYVINGNTYTTANTYRDTFPSVTGCDSIVITVLTVNLKYSVNNPQTICSGSSYVINGHTYTAANTYNDTLHSVFGCDSIVITQLTVNPTYSTNNPQTICSGSSYVINGHTYTVANTYHDTLHTVSGCDSIIVTQLTVNPSYSISNPQIICSGGSYVINGHTYTTMNTYRDTLHTILGCDSIIVTQLTVNAKPATSGITGNTNPQINATEAYSVVNTTGSMYSWIITGGTQVSGTNTNSITVQWGNTIGAGSVRVVETNNSGCKGDTVSQNTNIALPVKLIGFDARLQKESILLTWSTASEWNNDYFEVERSADGRNYTAIGNRIKGAGNSTKINSYELSDFSAGNMHAKQVLYRLKQVDFDGAVHYSHTVSVMLTGQPSSSLFNTVVYPNPSYAGEATLEYTLSEKSAVNISIFNLHGQLVKILKQEDVAEGQYKLTLPDLESGVYFVKVNIGEETRALKVIVK